MRLFCVFVVFAVHVLLNAVTSRVLGWFWVGLGKIAFFFMTLFFCVLESWTFGFFWLDAAISRVLGWF